MATNTPALLYRGNPQYGATSVVRTVTTAALTSNLVTLTFGSNHGLSQVGTLINVQGVGASYDGLFPVHSFPANNQATYVVTASNISSASVTPNGSAIFNSGITIGGSVSNVAIVNYTAIVSTSAAHGLAIGDIVRVNTGNTGIDGTWVVTSIPSASIFTFLSSTQTLASTAITQGAFADAPAVYTVPSSTTAIATNAIITNPTTSAILASLTIDGVAVAKQLSVPASSSTFIDIKQVIATTKTISVLTTSPQADVMISGMTVA
jgi:hypothetical protein